MARQKGARDDGRGRRKDDGGENLEEVVVRVNRSAKVMKGGRRFSFSTLVVVGNRSGRVGFGYGKARSVPGAMEKGVKEARKRLMNVPLVGTTIPHTVRSHFESSTVYLIPAAPGTGIVAGAAVRAAMELAGIRDVLTKVYGSTNPINVVKATFQGLEALRSREDTGKLRGVNLS